ncbi:MAG: hypothetical protein HYS78_00485 [Parcubacteria group bacterium]|nr:hypothetical protein [Parcubacteria group bacterium]
MIVFSFGWRRKGHSSCNIRLAKAAKRIIDVADDTVIVVAQRTTTVVLREFGISVEHTVERCPGYEGSEEVVRQAAAVFRRYRITEGIPVAQPFLQLTKCVQLVRKAGFMTPSFWKLCRMIGWIGFDRQSAQPWTRGPVRLVLYTFRQMFLGYRPPRYLSE